MRSLIVFATLAPSLAFAVPASTVCPSAPSATVPITQTLHDDFTTDTMLNPTVWTATTGNPFGNPANETETYAPNQTNFVNSPGAGSQVLRLSTNPVTGAAKPYASGAVTSLGKFSQLYGHFEASLRMPHQNGMWPAFWLIPEDNTWPPEIDIVEYIGFPNGQIPTSPTTPPYVGANVATTLHWTDAAGVKQQVTDGVNYGLDATFKFEPFSQQFHVYGVDWRPGLIEWLLDGQVIFCSEDAMAVPTKAMYLILNIGVTNGTQAAPGWAGYVPANATWPQSMDVKYVSVSQFRDLLPPPPPPAQVCVKTTTPICGTPQ